MRLLSEGRGELKNLDELRLRHDPAALDVAKNSPPFAPPPHLAAVDGLRGLAALIIVVYHLFTSVNLPEHRILGVNVLRPLHDGWAGVNLFLVLSGFCLFWPYARNANRTFEFGDFMLRRVRRIIPAYYASLLLVPLAFWLLRVSGLWTGESHLPKNALDVVLHLTLLHSLTAETIHSWSSVTWSLGLEWTWYLLFPLAVLLFRKLGAARGLLILGALTLAFRIGLYVVFGPARTFPSEQLETTFALRSFVVGRLFEFGIGMYLAWWLANRKITSRMTRTAITGLPIVLAAAHLATPVDVFIPVRDILYGIAGGLLLLAVLSPQLNPLKALAGSKLFVEIGISSYSLYLLHLPIAVGAAKILSRLGVQGDRAFLWSLLVVPLTVLAARAGYHLFEEPFLNSAKKRVSAQ